MNHNAMLTIYKTINNATALSYAVLEEVPFVQPVGIDGECNQVRSAAYILMAIFKIQEAENFVQPILEILFQVGDFGLLCFQILTPTL